MTFRVLVVDDDLPGLALAESVLSRIAQEVVGVKSGHECVAAFQLRKFDVVLMDNRMPGMSGLEATAEIRRIERESGRPRTPIIALTACAYPSEIEEFLRAGADDVLLKPYRIEELAAMLERWGPHA